MSSPRFVIGGPTGRLSIFDTGPLSPNKDEIDKSDGGLTMQVSFDSGSSFSADNGDWRRRCSFDGVSPLLLMTTMVLGD